MKIGSIVECVRACFHKDYTPNVPVVGGRYSVRDIVTTSKGNQYLRFNECVNPICPLHGCENAFFIEYFREIEFPPSIAEEIEECLTRELVDK